MRVCRAVSALSLLVLLVAAASTHTIPDDPAQSNIPPIPRLFPLSTWLRDHAVELLFSRHTTKVATLRAGYPTFSPNKYANEVVLRFNVTSFQEEEAIAEAAGRLFLDIWAVTRDFVDIRLRKDRIESFLGLLPDSLHEAHKILISDVGAVAYGTLPTHTWVAHEASAAKSGDAQRTLAAENDNVFFRDYRPLPVRAIQWLIIS